MSLDAATFEALQMTFLEESFEGLDRAEDGLLHLDTAATPELIGDLFRAIHSIKGGAGAFGIDEIGELAHAMENLLDDIRSGVTATPEMRAVLLRGVDTLRASLLARKDRRPVERASHGELCAAIAATRGKPSKAAAAPPTADAAVTDWRIVFAPYPGLARTGNDPLRMLRELALLGATDVVVDASRLPPLEELDPSECHLRWTLRVPRHVARKDLDELFAWVEGDCDLTIEREAPVAPVAVIAPPPPPSPTGAPVAAAAEPASSSGNSSVRVGIDKIDLLMNMVGELVITQSMLGELDGDGPLDTERIGRLREGLSLLARNTRSLQESVMRLRSMPVGAVFGRLPRLVHDLGIKLGKDVALEISGETIELDKTVLEKLGDPLVHIVRNSVDHGLETPEARLAAGKPRQGKIRLHAEHRGSAVVIEISDDGRGLDYPRILAVAKARGVVPEGAELRDDEIAQLIFAPGFSTAKAVSDVSGRGVGMDVVARHIKELHGEVQVESTTGEGTRTTLRLPLTLAIIDGQLIRLAEQTYVVPLLSIVETVQIDPPRLKRLGGSVVYRFRDNIVPIVDVAGHFGLEGAASDSKLLMIVEADGIQLGLVVDELQAQQQVVIKSLETNFGRVDGLAGATILGDGRVAFIVDIAGLARGVRRAGREQAA